MSHTKSSSNNGPVKEAKERHEKSTKRLIKKERESLTFHGNLLHKHYIDTFSPLLKTYRESKLSGKPGKWASSWTEIINIPNPVVAHITMKTILDLLSSASSRTSLAYRIGQRLEDELNFSLLKKKQASWWKKIKGYKDKRAAYKYKKAFLVKLANEAFGDTWKKTLPTTGKIHLGLSLLDLFRLHTGLILYKKKRINQLKFSYVVHPTDKAIKWITSVNEKAPFLFPYLMPITEPPVEWTSLYDGGYDFDVDVNWFFIKTRKKGLREIYREKDPNVYFRTAFKAANVIQRVPYRVNGWVYDIFSHVLKEGISVDGVVIGLSMIESSRKPKGECTREYRRCQAKYHRTRLKLMPKIISTQATMKLAKRFLDNHSIYFPVTADFRGRLYYAAKTLSPQGGDLAKGLLEFTNPTDLGQSEHWFLIGGANVYGIKGSLDERQEWVLKHERWIRAVADDPIGNRSFWLSAKDKAPFLAFCREFVDWIDNRHTFKTHLPVRLDHTASGLQIIALLKGDKELQRLTNLADVEVPCDIYKVIKDKLHGKLFSSARPEDHVWIAYLDRKLIKDLTVSYMYGARKFSLQKILSNSYMEHGEDPFGKNLYSEIDRLIKLYFDTFTEVTATPMQFMKDTRLDQGDEVLSWTSPSGFPVINQYNVQAATTVYTCVSGERVKAQANVDVDKLDIRAAKQSLPANKVHSYDSGLMHLVLTEEEWPDILTLHDCYGVPPRDCDKLQRTISKVMSSTFELDMPERMLYAAS